METEMPYGYCRCGCGQKTSLAKRSQKERGDVKGKPKKYIKGHTPKGKFGEKSHHWKGGRVDDGRGYVLILKPEHPNADKRGYVFEHVLIAEKALGKFLPVGAVVHHHNGTKDSGPLVICQHNAYHRVLHRRKRALDACGHASWRKCKYCKQYADPKNMLKNGYACYHSAFRSNYRTSHKINVRT